MNALRAIGLFLLLATTVSGEEVIWRKSSSPAAPTPIARAKPDPEPARFPLAESSTPKLRRVRAQNGGDFVLPPEYWPSTIGRELPASATETATSLDTDKAPKPTVVPTIYEAKVNPVTGMPWGAILSQVAGTQVMVGDYLMPADVFYAPEHRLHVSAEYLLWWTKGSNYPPLVTTDSPTAPENIRGALPPTGTGVILYGGQREDARLHSGARFGATYWLGECGIWGVDAGLFFLGERSDRFSASSDQFRVLARPFIDATTGNESRQLVATPGVLPADFFQLRGAISVDAPSKLWGWDLAMRRCLLGDECWNVHLLLGYRYLNLQEGLHITEDIVSAKAVPGAGGLLDPGNRIQVFDFFDTDNEFHGGQIGLRGEMRRGRLVFEGRARLSLGFNQQSVTINGAQVITRLDGSRQQFQGGLLAVATNIGVASQQRFSVVPELGLKVGYQVTDSLRAYVGYDFLYWTDVLRAGDQVDRRVNPALVPGFIIPPQPVRGPLLPRVPLATSDYWAQGFNFGVEWRY